MKDIYELSEEKVVITAEIGINHNGDLKLAEEMIDAAADCGVDAVKFQCFKTEYMYSRKTPGFSHTDTDIFAQVQGLEIREDGWPVLRKRAQDNGLFFSASIFDSHSLHTLKPTGVDFLKVASAEITNREFLLKQKGLSDIYVISTGMALLDEIATTLRFLTGHGIEKIILLECTSSYPAPPDSICLLNIDFLRDTFQVPVGFSDHSLGIHYAIAAVARGACFIEKHFTLDKKMQGPDQAISANREEMKELVKNIREIEQSMAYNNKMLVSPYEKESREIGRKSVIACIPIKKGELITNHNTIIKRPGKGVPPEEAPFLYGRTADHDIAADEWITWDMVC